MIIQEIIKEINKELRKEVRTGVRWSANFLRSQYRKLRNLFNSEEPSENDNKSDLSKKRKK